MVPLIGIKARVDFCLRQKIESRDTIYLRNLYYSSRGASQYTATSRVIYLKVSAMAM